MQSEFAPILNRCRLTEEQFLCGNPAMFKMDTPNPPGGDSIIHIVAFYINNRVLIQTHTYWSLAHIRKVSKNAQLDQDDNVVLVDPIVVEDFTKLELMLEDIRKNIITTKQIDDKELQNRIGNAYLTAENPLCDNQHYKWNKAAEADAANAGI